MSRYIDADKLKADIEKRLERYDPHYTNAGKELERLLSLITSLQQEQPDKYETALEKAREWMPNVNQGGHFILIDIFPELGKGLDPRYGGRKQEQPKEDLEKEVHNYLKIHHLRIKDGGRVVFDNDDSPNFMYDIRDIARHFYELGLNARKEK